jgi:hypothetical protein
MPLLLLVSDDDPTRPYYSRGLAADRAADADVAAARSAPTDAERDFSDSVAEHRAERTADFEQVADGGVYLVAETLRSEICTD